ncbi:nucleotidyl transferase AbiEii/AbiGii toxin family protein [Bradyrhizobium algeriense]|uniref:nucleotidyl transferase AbiEii/AbiGii toxin family protein n=1 Tax=Bradyrhizobium algeriense TaxID=634784 RepID=UPI000D38444F|nr:nucleotidyl transferase AbiEii/AbiGii toxin family protein [Bradyrhizobium algeriense]
MKTGKNHNKPPHIQSRKDFFDWLAQTIKIDGITKVERDTAFDDVPDYRNAGIRLIYTSIAEPMEGLRDGALLEAGFDKVAPNTPEDISSWLYDRAVASNVDIIDNRANAVPCYDPSYTFVEKLQTISTKFRNQQSDVGDPVGFLRHYYDVYELLQRPEVQEFIGTEEYKQHKQKRFRQGDNQNIAENEAFLLSDAETTALYANAYDRSRALYYDDPPSFEEIKTEIPEWIDKL